MTVVDQNQPQPQRRPSPEPQAPRTPGVDQALLTRADQARTDAHRVAALVQIAREGHGEARDHGEDAHRLREAIDVLYDRVASKPGDRRTRLDRALHGMDGALDETALLEYLDLTGREGMSARGALQRILDQRTWPEFDGGQEFSDRLHALAHTWEQGARVQEAAVRPALPPAVAQPVAAPLPRREPIAPSQPPMVPPAPPESPVEQTGQIAFRAVEAMREAGHEMPVSESALASMGSGAPDFGPSPDPRFSPAAVPPVRSGDTQRLMAPLTDEVLEHLDMRDASKVDGEPVQKVVPPFVSGAAGSGNASKSAAAGSERSGSDD